LNIKYLLSLKLDIFHDELTIYKKFIDKKYDYIMKFNFKQQYEY